MKYVDTSVIVAALDYLDYRREKAEQFLEQEDDKVVSELVLAELASVFSRRGELLRAMERLLGVKRELGVILALVYVLRKFNLQYIKVNDSLLLPPIGRVSRIVAKAVELSVKVKLRTLDLLHLAYMLTLRDEGYPLRELVTLDKDFIDNKSIIEETLGIRITTI